MLPLSFVVFSLFSLTVGAQSAPSELYSPLVSQKVLAVAQSEPNPAKYPQYTDRTAGAWLYFSPNTWTSGFFPTTLYALNTRAQLCGTSDGQSWVKLGRQWSTGEIPLEQSNGVGHDVGFLSMPFIEELAINSKNTTAITAVKTFASTLAGRYNSVVGCTRSWDSSDPTDFQVIIDNMMNLELLFYAETITKNHTYRQIAISHADKTLQNHVRADGSSFHVVHYNTTTGAVTARVTSQGYSDSSTWSRGQAWGIYGFANMHLNTQDVKYLNVSRRMADYFLNNIPSDGIVPWDFNAPLSPPRPADSSAATVAATGLLLLAKQELNSTEYSNVADAKAASAKWSNAAIKILSDITKLAWKPKWQSLLSNGTVNNPALNNLTGIVYGDYYYIKAGNDLLSMNLTTCP